ncbi:NACHT domain-containing protein [Streptomyces sp. NBC_01216]|uniref:NACHT domain-containing protein n=1 Tax=Streptomyces sp. NBC_01216 TaxID=2903778 RepID=UPI002E168770|nr:NACHT domain-containing protein [Streptomyces sp. NBC_01216]
MPDPITTGLVSTAGSAAGRAVGPLLLGGARSRLERRAIRKRAATVELHGADDISKALVGLSAVDREKILGFMKSAEFENLCFEVAVAACMPGNPEAHLEVLKNTMETSLRRYSGVEDGKTRLIAETLFSEVAAISWSEVNRHQKDSGISKRSLTPEIVASHIASAARNAELHRRIASLVDIDRFSTRLSQQCARIHGRIRPAQTESGARVKFEDLYVPPTLAVGDEDPGDEGFSDARTLLRETGRLVVLGDPGGGKTTLALKLTIDVARGLGTGAALQTPLRIVLREYASHYKSNQESIIDFLEKQCKADYSTPAPEGAIDYLLLNGRAVVIFDGLDELTDTSLRAAIVDAVEAFTHAYPTAPILVTSRKVGYEMAPLDESLFFVTHLSPFNGAQQKQYVKKWFLNVRGSAQEEGMADRFLSESSHARDLTSNPLMLGLMCALYRGEGYIPRNRPDLYRRCSEFLFERWDASRGITIPKPFERGIQFAMFSLALSMLRNQGEGGGMTERELVRYTSDYLLGQQYEDRDTSDAAAEAFVKYCRGRAWVLTDVGTNPNGERIYSFTHRTFLEYFSARQLVRNSGNVDSLYQELHAHLVNESWDVTSQLAVQFLDERLGDAANDFVSMALSESECTSERRKKSALISFCARLLEFITLRPSVVREVVSALLRLTIQSYQGLSEDQGAVPASHRRDLKVLNAAWAGVCLCAPETRTVVNDELMKSLASGDHGFDELRLAISMADFVPRHASLEVRRFWADQDRKNASQIPLVDLARRDIRAAAVAVLFGLVEAAQAVSWHGASVMTEQKLAPHGTGGPENVLHELGYPGLRWNHEESGRIAGEVVSALLPEQTPWMEGRQSFITYSSRLPLDPNNTACQLLGWMLGMELEADERNSSEEDRDGEILADFGAHELFARVAKAHRRGVYDSGLDKYRAMFTPEFFDFVCRWCKGEFSLSTPDSYEG